MATPHIESKKNDIAKTVLMPGDPLRSKYIADTYLENVRKVNSTRNMDAYTGYYKGKEVTIFSSGMGNPSMGIYSHELFNEYDVDVIIRIGSCGSYKENINLHDVLLATTSYSNTNYGREYANYEKNIIASNEEVNNVIESVANKNNVPLIKGQVHTTDAFYNNIDFTSLNALAVEMECYSLFLNAFISNKKASAILTVSDSLITKEEMTREEREKDLDVMIKLALDSILYL